MHDHQRSGFLLRAAAVAALCAADALAQGVPPAPAVVAATPEQQAEEQRQHDVLMPKVFLRGVEVRVPSEMRDSEPQLLGLEEAGISFRDRTPALAEGDIAPTIVDPEQLRQQRLAAYERPWASFGSTSAAAPRAGARPAPGTPAPPSAPPSGGGWLWSLVAASALVGGYVALRRRANA